MVFKVLLQALVTACLPTCCCNCDKGMSYLLDMHPQNPRVVGIHTYVLGKSQLSMLLLALPSNVNCE